MRSQIQLHQHACGHLVGTRVLAMPIRDKAEFELARGMDVVLDFAGVEATQSFIDELVGVLILKHGPDVLDKLIFKACTDNVRAIIEFVAADRCDQYLKQHTH